MWVDKHSQVVYSTYKNFISSLCICVPTLQALLRRFITQVLFRSILGIRLSAEVVFFLSSPGQEKMILEVEVVVVRQQYCKARYLQVGRELGKEVWEPCGSLLGSE